MINTAERHYRVAIIKAGSRCYDHKTVHCRRFISHPMYSYPTKRRVLRVLRRLWTAHVFDDKSSREWNALVTFLLSVGVLSIVIILWGSSSYCRLFQISRTRDRKTRALSSKMHSGDNDNDFVTGDLKYGHGWLLVNVTFV